MKIKTITSQSRRDFYAIYECEHCKNEHEASGYDDAHFYNNVIPFTKCQQCDKIAPSTYRPLAPLYPENKII